MDEGTETYWVALGKQIDGGTYPQSLIEHERWKDSAMRDNTVVALVEVTVNLKTGGTSSTLIKNTA